jgi:hypothetical protein
MRWGKNFVPDLVAGLPLCYELVSLDSQLEIVRQNNILQTNALEIVKVQKGSC